MLDPFGNHNVGFPTRRLICLYVVGIMSKEYYDHKIMNKRDSFIFKNVIILFLVAKLQIIL